MKLTKKTIEVTTYNIEVSNEERRTIVGALALAREYDRGTDNSSMYKELFFGIQGVNAKAE